MSVAADDVEALKAENTRLKRDLENALLQLLEFKRHMFGRKSEKLSIVSDSQTQLFDVEMPELGDTEETEVKPHKRSKRKSRKLPKDLPRQRVEYQPEETNCAACGEELKKIGEDITEELEFGGNALTIQLHLPKGEISDKSRKDFPWANAWCCNHEYHKIPTERIQLPTPHNLKKARKSTLGIFTEMFTFLINEQFWIFCRSMKRLKSIWMFPQVSGL